MTLEARATRTGEAGAAGLRPAAVPASDRPRLRVRDATTLDRRAIAVVAVPSHATEVLRRALRRRAASAPSPAAPPAGRSDAGRSGADDAGAGGSAELRPREAEGQNREAPSAVAARAADEVARRPVVLRLRGLSRSFGATVAVDGVELEVREGSLFGVVGPNGAGKTTTLSMVTGLLRPDAGQVVVGQTDVWADPEGAKRVIGVLPDRLRLFDRLTGAQFLFYAGVLRGLDEAAVRTRTADLAAAFGLEDALGRLVADYSAGMAKKIALAAAMIHAPRVLVLDEPFESVDPVSAASVTEILQRYVAAGGAVLISSHSMDLIQRVCDHVAIIVSGRVMAAGPVADVRGDGTLEERFVELVGGRAGSGGMEWLQPSSA